MIKFESLYQKPDKKANSLEQEILKSTSNRSSPDVIDARISMMTDSFKSRVDPTSLLSHIDHNPCLNFNHDQLKSEIHAKAFKL